MKSHTLLLGLLLSLSILSQGHAEEAKKSITVEGRPPKTAFSEQRPAYLHFKKVTVTRIGSQRLLFEITMRGEIPKNPKESVSIYFGFDIDRDSSTGGVAAHASNFGQDLGFFIYQNQGDTHFKVSSNSAEYKGRSRKITVSGLKVQGDQITVKVRSKLFSMFDSFKFFVSASQRIYERDKKISETQVDTTPIRVF